ncbi:MAG: class I SAM-dependent methyltransferase [Aggregatilineales bacterium]
MKSIQNQFHHPQGLAGRIIGAVMAIENRERIEWAIQQMHIQPDDNLLEIGFGPGLGIEYAAKQAKHGFVAGVDVSIVMVKQASKRNQSAKVDLRYGSAEHIPFPDDSFSLVYAINSFHHWDDPHSAFQEIQRVLQANGRMVIVEQPPTRVTEASVINARGRTIQTALLEGGFSHVSMKSASLSRGWTVFVEARC